MRAGSASAPPFSAPKRDSSQIGATVIPLSAMMRSVVAVALAVLALVAPSSARATGRFPASSAVVFDPHDSKTVLVRTTFGLLKTRDGGDSWRWVCDHAIGTPAGEEPFYAITAQSTILAASSAGL